MLKPLLFEVWHRRIALSDCKRMTWERGIERRQFGLPHVTHAPATPWDCRAGIGGGVVLRFSGPSRWRDVLGNLQYQRHTPHRRGAHADDDQNCPNLKHSRNHALSSYSETRARVDDMPIALTASETGDLQARRGELDFCDCVSTCRRAALESAGAIFVDENGEGPGVRLRKAPHGTKGLGK